MGMTAVFVLAFVWCLFGMIYVAGRRRAAPQAATTARSGTSRLGIAMQLAAYAIVFAFERPPFAAIVPVSSAANDILLAVASLMGVASIALCHLAARTLGKQWSMAARVVAEHELVQQGPFGVVRNPIYLAMFGLLLQAGLVVSTWEATAPAVVVFLIGTWIRIHEEETILRRQFGAAFDAYARRVPAFIPGWRQPQSAWRRPTR